METVLSSATKRVVISGGSPFVMIGERINPTGRKLLGAEMKAGLTERIKADAMLQVQSGATVLDVNAGVPGTDEAALLVATVRAVMQVTDVPLCLDSSDLGALEAALADYPGKALVNSVTAEDDRMDRILPLVARHGAAVIAMANDDTGISMVPRERLEIARRIVGRAEDYGIAPQDVIIDPIAMTVAADPQSVLVTLETMRLIQAEMGNNMICGASNISFGLPLRPSLNAAFIPLASAVGLTCAITNPLISEIRTAALAADLLLGRDEYAMRWIADYRAHLPGAVG